MIETVNAWMAGFIDGEGCLTIAKQIRKGRPSPAFRPYICISNTNRKVIDIFRKKYGGKIYNDHERRKDKRGNNWAVAYDWRCPDSKICQLVNDVLPYLKLKMIQASILLEFMDKKNAFDRKKYSGQRGGSAPLSIKEINYRERLRKKIKKLNTKGVFAREVMPNVPRPSMV